MNMDNYNEFKKKVLKEYTYPERSIVLELMRYFEESEDSYQPAMQIKKIIKKDWSTVDY